MAWAPNTQATRNSQWSKYLSFCADNGLIAIPAEAQTIARFLVFLSRSVKYGTINNYVSAINRLHNYYGHQINFRDFFMVKLVFMGIKRQLGDFIVQKIPLTPKHLLRMYGCLDVSNRNMLAMWCGIILSFRTLLRKSNIVPDSTNKDTHVLRRSSVLFCDEGMILKVNSTKTLQYIERVLEIPVNSIPGSPLCAVSLLKHHFSLFPGGPDSFLLYKHTPKGNIPITYGDLLSFLKDLVSRIGLDPKDVGLHSLRRSGVAFLHSLRIPLEDIKCIGDWKSLAILSYLVTPMDRKKSIEKITSDALRLLHL